jgi:anti-sigma factor RsiW
MRCGELESDLLLHGLGELPFWRSWRVSLHLTGCADCRQRAAGVAAVAAKMARALKPVGGAARLPRPAVTVAQGWLAVACVVLAVVGLLLGARFVSSRVGGSQPSASQQDIPCRPDLPSDKCR